MHFLPGQLFCRSRVARRHQAVKSHIFKQLVPCTTRFSIVTVRQYPRHPVFQCTTIPNISHHLQQSFVRWKYSTLLMPARPIRSFLEGIYQYRQPGPGTAYIIRNLKTDLKLQTLFRLLGYFTLPSVFHLSASSYFSPPKMVLADNIVWCSTPELFCQQEI